jgi:hypothetical protein
MSQLNVRAMPVFFLLLVAVVLIAPLPSTRAQAGQGLIEGTPTTWQPLGLRFDGPFANETDNAPHPFLDYRLTVTFIGPQNQRYVVPGYFDGDGAGNGSGAVWRARFAPDAPGTWSYSASFRTGEEVAVSLDANAGTATSFDGARGSFVVAPHDAATPGFARWGRLEVVGGHYLKFRNGPYFLKSGTNSPENLLGYVGFDNTIDQGGLLNNFLHRYEPHVADWREGDPDWGAGKGKGIVGALNYLADQGVNAIYFLPMNLGGDGQEIYPFVSAARTRFAKTHYDVSKLHQWGLVLNHAQRRGLRAEFVLAETEAANEQWLDDGLLGVERKLFYRELVARFGHLLAVKWVLCEENDRYPVARLQAFADYLRALDPYDHPIAVHNHPNDFSDYEQIVGDARFATTAIQYDPDLAGEYVETWRMRSQASGQPWVIEMDENTPPNVGLGPTNAPDLRRRVLYDVYFSGGNIAWYAGYYPLPIGGDVNLEDFRTREAMWRYTAYARRLVELLPFWEMEPADALLAGEAPNYGGGEVWAETGNVYAVYLPNARQGGALDLRAAPGGYTLRWFNPRSGEFEGEEQIVNGGASVVLGAPPHSPTDDWVALLTRVVAPTPMPAPTPLPTVTPAAPLLKHFLPLLGS